MLSRALPHAFSASQAWIKEVIEHYPRMADFIQIQHVSAILNSQLVKMGQNMVSFSLTVIPNVLELILYFVLVPILVLFFLKDGPRLMQHSGRYFPTNRGLTQTVWEKVRVQIGAYVRGRALEVLVIGVASALVFWLLGLHYAILCGVLAGLSVLVPYVGAVVIYLIVFILGLFQWGFAIHLFYVLFAFAVILFIDGYILQPWLFAEVMDLSPLVVVLSVLFFGGLWGFWGVFFAIPLVGVIKILIESWPSKGIAKNTPQKPHKPPKNNTARTTTNGDKSMTSANNQGCKI
jgi:putative permease